MFQALLTHPQVALYKWHLVYYVRVMSVGLISFGVSFQLQLNFWKCEVTGCTVRGVWWAEDENHL
jgi:hypothetical protein